MPSIDFVDFNTVVPASWLNEVDELTFPVVSNFVPSATFLTPGTSVFTNNSSGSYIRMGQLAVVNFRIDGTFVKGTGTGSLIMTGLPFVTDDSPGASVLYQGLSGASLAVRPHVTAQGIAGTNTARFWSSGPAQTASTVTDAAITDGVQIVLQGTLIYTIG